MNRGGINRYINRDVLFQASRDDYRWLFVSGDRFQGESSVVNMGGSVTTNVGDYYTGLRAQGMKKAGEFPALSSLLLIILILTFNTEIRDGGLQFIQVLIKFTFKFC